MRFKRIVKPTELTRRVVLGACYLALFASVVLGFESQMAGPFQALRSAHDPQRRADAEKMFASKLNENVYKQLNLREELPVILDALNDSDDYVALKAASILVVFAMIHADSRAVLHDAVPAMTAHLSGSNPEWKPMVIAFVGLVEPHPSDALIASMLDLLKDRDWKARAVAIESLAKLKPLPKPALDALIAKMKDSSDKQAVTKVIQEFGRNQVSDPRAIQEITVALDGTDVYAQRTAAMSLAQIGPPAASPAVPALVLLVNDPKADKMAAENARGALKRIQGK